MDASKSFVMAYGVKTAYIDVGRGSPLVLLHGLGGDSGEFSLFIPVFSRHHRVVALDLPGHGSSELPGRRFTVADFADHLRAFLDELGVERPSLLGLSMGGGIAIEYALRYPDRLDKLVLVSTSPRVPVEARAAAERWLNAYRERGWEGLFEVEVRDIFHPRFLEAHRHEIEALRSLWRNRRLETLAWAAEALREWDRTGDLHRITHPTLIIHGDSDRVVPPREALLLHERIPNSRLVMLREAGHAAIVEKAEEFTREVLQFLSST